MDALLDQPDFHTPVHCKFIFHFFAGQTKKEYDILKEDGKTP